ncbi:LysR family transcriptional regulator [Lactobacillus selangorensis]|uniref:Bacterial regulatory helix-turn-helix, lysR family protein n=1 Tax=Lactobacillus selangorensis TaxID=81857 RepID=A0A0R2GB13_9LACO|nr:LysR family transcriptional regulator [Lactobacillus selangorensis]KRN34004.1 bacterial regulatory helix-turn-helix, lysR family protein [Lactobacillus selangorensis]
MKTKQESIFSSKTLTYFLQLAETMNYTQAAQLLGITQPALTQQIKKLERVVGAPLFYSVGKKLHLSDAGKTMLTTTHSIYDLLNHATDEIQKSTSATSGKISIGLLSSIESSVLEDFIIAYFKENPHVEISLHLLTRKEIWDRLENNHIDLAVMYLPDDSIKNWKPYATKKIIDEQLLFLHHNEKLAHRKRIAYKDTLDKPWVTYPNDYYLAEMIHETYKNHLMDQPQSVAQFTSPYQIAKFANVTDVNTALPMSFYNAHTNEIDLYALPFEPAINFKMSFVFRRDKNHIPRIEHFLTAFDQFLADDDYVSRLQQLNQH